MSRYVLEVKFIIIIIIMICLARCLQSPDGQMTWGQEMQSALEELVVLLKDEHTISSFELYNSGLVQTLLSILCNVSLDSAV